MKIIRKFGDARHGWRGLRAVWREEWHFKYQLLFALIALVLAYVAGATSLQLVVLTAALAIALAGEIINTAIEDICNYMQSDHDQRIGMIKDMSQAFVIVSAVPAAVVLAWIVVGALV